MAVPFPRYILTTSAIEAEYADIMAVLHRLPLHVRRDFEVQRILVSERCLFFLTDTWTGSAPVSGHNPVAGHAAVLNELLNMEDPGRRAAQEAAETAERIARFAAGSGRPSHPYGGFR